MQRARVRLAAGRIETVCLMIARKLMKFQWFATMKDRSKRSVSSWFLSFVWCILLVIGLGFLTVRLFSAEDYQPQLVSKWNIPATELVDGEDSATPAISIRETVLLPDEVLVFLKYLPSTALFAKNDITCIYSPLNSSRRQPPMELSPTSVESRHGNSQIVRCPLQPRGTIVSLAVKRNGNLRPGRRPTYRWDSLAYEAVVDEDNSTVVFVKGLNLRSARAADPSKYKCVYGWDLTDSESVQWADVVSAAQEIVRCRTPSTVLNRFGSFNDPIKVSVTILGKRRTLNSVARLELAHQLKPKPLSGVKHHKMCVCTMLRNQARFLPEWIMYHARIGVDRWFIYDNNSNDGIDRVVDTLAATDYNVTWHAWPWIKTQEAGLAHCALRARDSCQWVGFIDIDEFLHVPSHLSSLHDVVTKYANTVDVAEVRVMCRTFGPSGLKEHPKKGVMAGYTCRTAVPERHKSIIKPEGLNPSLINVVHHFHLKTGLQHVNADTEMVVINHYKYQVWEVFKEKFYRRVATYVSDWQQERKVGSKDRAPGLGTKPVEPGDWSTRFCEVKDTGLKEWVLEIFADRKTGVLPWENYQLGKNSR